MAEDSEDITEPRQDGCRRCADAVDALRIEIKADIAALTTKQDLRFSELTHALQSHNDRLNAHDHALADVTLWRTESKAAHDKIYAQMTTLTGSMKLVLDAIQLIAHVAEGQGKHTE